MPWQEHAHVSAAEIKFRAAIELRKERILARRLPVRHPVLLGELEFERARRNISRSRWAAEWFRKTKEIADYVSAQPPDYVDRMIPELTPTNPYGFTCPNCVGRLSQEGSVYYGGIPWDYRNPEAIRCRFCGQIYPDARFRETGRLSPLQ